MDPDDCNRRRQQCVIQLAEPLRTFGCVLTVNQLHQYVTDLLSVLNSWDGS